MRWPSVRGVGAWVVVVAAVAVDVRRVLAQQQFNDAASLPGLVQQVQQPFASTGDRSARVEWLVNVLRALEQNGSLQQLLRQGIRDSDASIPDSLAEAIVNGLLGPHEAKISESMAVGGVEGYYGGGDYKDKDDYDDDSSDDDSSDDDSSDDDSSDDDSSDDYKRKKHKRRHRKKHHHKKHKCKCKKKKKKKKKDMKDESNVFSKIRGVNIGSTFANIQITGGNATAPETPTPTGFPGSNPSNFGPGINTGWGPGAFGGPGGIPPIGGLPLGAGAGPGRTSRHTHAAGPGLGPGSPLGGGGQGLPGNASAGAAPTAATPTTTTEVPTTQAPATEAPATDTPGPSAASDASATGATASSPPSDPPANKPGGMPGDPKDPPTPLPTRMRPSASAQTPRPRFRR